MKLFRCPRCGKGKLFRGLITVAPACGECGLSFQGHEQGDGPAFFSILIIGALAAIAAAIVEIKYEPPFWIHAALWLPLVIFGSLFSLRVCKAALIAMQYRVKPDDFA